ncbi:hypothetical protein DFH28DRAFT_534608 [Melampsora americana]|nr:hypothetical protein DFH28DRAFT_534608 [Melampsora americana]
MSPPPPPPPSTRSQSTNSNQTTTYQKHSISLSNSTKKSKSKSQTQPSPSQSQNHQTHSSLSQVPSSPTKKIKLSHPTLINSNSNSTTSTHQPQENKMTNKKKPKPKLNQKPNHQIKKKSTKSFLSISISLILKVLMCYLLLAYFHFCPKDPSQNPFICSNLAELHWTLEPKLTPLIQIFNQKLNLPLRNLKRLPIWNQKVLPIWNHQLLPIWNHQLLPNFIKVYNQIEKLDIQTKSKPLINHLQIRYQTKLLPHLHFIQNTFLQILNVLKKSKFINQTKQKSNFLKSQIKLNFLNPIRFKLIPFSQKTYQNEINPFYIKYLRPKLIQLKNHVLEHHLWFKSKETLKVWSSDHLIPRFHHFIELYVQPQVRKILKKMEEYRDRKQSKVEVDDLKDQRKLENRSRNEEVKPESVMIEKPVVVVVDEEEESQVEMPAVIIDEKVMSKEPVVPEKLAAVNEKEQIVEESDQINEEQKLNEQQKRTEEPPVVIEKQPMIVEPTVMIEEEQVEVIEEPESMIEEQSTIFETEVTDVPPLVKEHPPIEVKESVVKVEEPPVSVKESPVTVEEPPMTVQKHPAEATEPSTANEQEPSTVIEPEPTRSEEEQVVNGKNPVRADTEPGVSDDQMVIEEDPLVESNEEASPALEVQKKVEMKKKNEDVFADDLDDFLNLIKDEEEDDEKKRSQEEEPKRKKRRTEEETALDRKELESYQSESYEKMKEMEEEQLGKLIELIEKKRNEANLNELKEMLEENQVRRVKEEREKLKRKLIKWFEKHQKVELKSNVAKIEEIRLICKKSKEKFKSKVIENELKRLNEFRDQEFKVEHEILQSVWIPLENYMVEVQAVLGPGFTWLDDVTYKDWESKSMGFQS